MFEEFPEYFEAEWIFTEKNSISKKFIPWKILRGGGIKKKYHRHNGVSVGWVTSFVGEYFFFLAEYFFLAFGQKTAKKKYQPRKKKYHQQTKLSSNGNTIILIISYFLLILTIFYFYIMRENARA